MIFTAMYQGETHGMMMYQSFKTGHAEGRSEY